MADSSREALRAIVLTSQIIVGALAAGIISFAIVVVVVVGPANLQTEPGVITLMATGVAIVLVCLSFIVPSIVVNAARRRIAEGTWRLPGNGTMPDGLARLGDEGRLATVYQTALIIGAAMCEGPAFFSLVAAMIEKSLPGLAVAAFCLLMLLARFPTMNRLENWLDGQRRAIEADRMLQR